MRHASSRHLRYQQVASVLTHHGLGYLVGMLGLERFVPFHRGLLGHPRRSEPYTRLEHLHMEVEGRGRPNRTFISQGRTTAEDRLERSQ